MPEQTLNQLFRMYFSGTAPFGSGRKKSEFPDAANVIAIEEWIRINTNEATEVYIVSGDSDLAECCAESSNLIHAETLTQVLSAALRSEWGDDRWTSERLGQLLRDDSDNFIERLKTDFLTQEFEVESGYGDMDDIDVSEVHIFDVYTIDRKDISASSIDFLLQVYVDVIYEADVTFEDNAQQTAIDFNTSGSVILEFMVDSCLHLDGNPRLEIRKMNLIDPGIININVSLEY